MTTLLSYLRADLPGLMKRRETVTLRAVRDVVGAIENAEVTYLAEPYAEPVGSEFISGGTRFGFAERVVRDGGRTDATKELNHRLFVVVQTQYPRSEWAKRYKTWE